MIDITYAILSMNVHFDKKRQVTILCTFPSDSNARNITLYCEFSNAVHAIRTLPAMNDKTQSYIFTSGSRRLRGPHPLEINMEIDVLFSYCHERPSDLTMVCKGLDVPFEWNIYRYAYIDESSYLFNKRHSRRLGLFRKKYFKPKSCIRAWWGDTRVNTCLHHARNRIAVQTNALISTIIFTLKQVFDFVNFPRCNTASALQQIFCQSKLIITIWESIYQIIQLYSQYGHYPITPVALKSFLDT